MSQAGRILRRTIVVDGHRAKDNFILAIAVYIGGVHLVVALADVVRIDVRNAKRPGVVVGAEPPAHRQRAAAKIPGGDLIPYRVTSALPREKPATHDEARPLTVEI